MAKPTVPSENKFREGVLPILVASALWAFGYFLRKWLLRDIPPLVLTGAISTLVSLFIFVFYRLKARKLWKRFKTHKWRFIGLSVTGVLISSTLMLVAFDHLDLGVATMLEKLQPLFTVFMAAIVLKEKLPLRLLPWCGLALAASYFISTPHPLSPVILKSNMVGIAAVVGAAFVWSITSVIGRSLAKEDIPSAEIVFFRFAITAVLAVPFVILAGQAGLSAHFTPMAWTLIAVAAMGSTGFGYVLYYKGLKWIDAPTAGFLELVTPVVALTLGIIFLKERLTITQWAAIPVMLFSVYRITAMPRRKPAVEEVG